MISGDSSLSCEALCCESASVLSSPSLCGAANLAFSHTENQGLASSPGWSSFVLGKSACHLNALNRGCSDDREWKHYNFSTAFATKLFLNSKPDFKPQNNILSAEYPSRVIFNPLPSRMKNLKPRWDVRHEAVYLIWCTTPPRPYEIQSRSQSWFYKRNQNAHAQKTCVFTISWGNRYTFVCMILLH